jgi:UDP-GlcNAc:undecaprenyl-phosphate/decaprenyl-phosphate GlcNAc-1-phosphate transferase
LIPVVALVVLFLGIYLGRVRVYTEGAIITGSGILKSIEDLTHKRHIFEILLDVILITLAYYGAYLLRFDGGLPDTQMNIFFFTLPLVIAAQMLLFLLGGVYRGLWHYMSLEDLLIYAKAILCGALTCAGIILALYGRLTPPSVLVLYPLLLLVLISASRFSFRLFRTLVNGQAEKRTADQPILIYGANDDGMFLLRQLLNNPEHRFHPIGFVDDDLCVTVKSLAGYRIYARAEVPDLIHTKGIEQVLVASSDVPEHDLRLLRQQGLVLKRIGIRIEAEPELIVSRTGAVG